MSEKTSNPSEAVTSAWTSIMRARERLLAAIEADLKAAGMPPLAWYDVLWELTRSENGKLRPYEIEERTLLAQYNLSRLIGRLEKEGLVRREAFAEDGRGRWVVMSDAGRKLRERMWTVYARSIETHVGCKLAENEAKTIVGLLDRFL
ncbi:MarR family transcriptional regulator [Rhizobium leguminosarum bv. trifolii]|nr:helix-turn-helix domain-containing protein [Rhizobium leguminosarum]MBY5916288.1 MarR family transcriptional regulator [Rhizobium leguminosarum]OBY05609.1 MarR family transcriptional regulator [Rhizobium leguminosarum bv. trifolii]TBE94803.1 MarR family transcriptional regulator [Rhizobium leguminosarum]TBZ96511.1 MarR family transcriptional regulator [Rhizobium leguminosarum bv. viciae]TCA45718.1 MarR family transcriptional regulator [Rhizobium leguminosarum bv. viciae]